jgi:hypothetical protein
LSWGAHSQTAWWPILVVDLRAWIFGYLVPAGSAEIKRKDSHNKMQQGRAKTSDDLVEEQWSEVVTFCDGSNSMTYIVTPIIVIKSTPLAHSSLSTEIPSFGLIRLSRHLAFETCLLVLLEEARLLLEELDLLSEALVVGHAEALQFRLDFQAQTPT